VRPRLLWSVARRRQCSRGRWQGRNDRPFRMVFSPRTCVVVGSVAAATDSNESTSGVCIARPVTPVPLCVESPWVIGLALCSCSAALILRCRPLRAHLGVFLQSFAVWTKRPVLLALHWASPGHSCRCSGVAKGGGVVAVRPPFPPVNVLVPGRGWQIVFFKGIYNVYEFR
jgi:hypothetical protein